MFHQGDGQHQHRHTDMAREKAASSAAVTGFEGNELGANFFDVRNSLC